MTRPLISVCVVTYNQEAFIKQCLEGIAVQCGDFELEVIISDDCSTDSTREIINDFIEANPEINVRNLSPEDNRGAVENFLYVHDQAKGDYVCHCDGDDFWLPGKLDYQLGLFQKHPELVQTWHCANKIDDNDNEIGLFPSKLAKLLYPRWVDAKDIASSYAIVGHHSTQMYKRSARKFNRDTEVVLDYWVAFNLALNGKSYYSKEVYSAYRVGEAISLTKTKGRKRLTVDALGLHLLSIVNNYPHYAKYARANMAVRYFFSKLRKHDIALIKNVFDKSAGSKLGISLYYAFKSTWLFILQKI